MRKELNGVSTLLSSNDLFSSSSQLKVWLTDIVEIEINDKFIFATRRIFTLAMKGHRNPSYQLWISINRKKFGKALFPPSHLQSKFFHVADASPEIIFVGVTYDDLSTHLYKSGKHIHINIQVPK